MFLIILFRVEDLIEIIWGCCFMGVLGGILVFVIDMVVGILLNFVGLGWVREGMAIVGGLMVFFVLVNFLGFGVMGLVVI